MRTLLLSLTLVACAAPAQWVNHPAPGVPRTRDGKVNLAAPTPRARDGKPDLSGVWHVVPTGRAEMKRLFGDGVDTVEVPGMEIDTISKYAINVLQDYKPDEVRMQPQALALIQERAKGEGKDLPSTHCLPLGLPLATLVSEYHKIVQTPGLILMLLELDNGYRQIYTDGRKLPADPSPSWYGYSAGRWEKDTLVVETAGFNDKGWLDVIGHPRSESMRMTERYTRRNFGYLDVEMTFDDPKMYSRPFSIKVTHQAHADSDVLEYICAENEKDRPHMGLK